MSKISSYSIIATPVAGDIVIGTDVSDKSNKTKNFNVEDIAALAKNAGVLGLSSFQDNAAALVGGLAIGTLYRTSGTGAAPLNAAGIVMVVV
jgi:hypothetical protein